MWLYLRTYHFKKIKTFYVTIIVFQNHSIDFARYSENWGGAVATITPTEGAYVWGAVWKVQNDNLPALDK